MRLARDGYHVLAHFHRNAAGAETTLSLVREAGGTADVVGFDTRDPRAVEAALDVWFKASPDASLAALVNNAGVHKDGLAGMLSDEMFDDVVRTNLYGPFFLMRWAARRMIRQRKGVIVNISSLAGQTGNAGQINYAASKAGVIAMTKTLAMELGSRGVRVNAVAPGLIETEMIEGLSLETFKERIPLKRLGRADEVAGVVSFLCSPDASYVTGATISVNGGLFPS